MCPHVESFRVAVEPCIWFPVFIYKCMTCFFRAAELSEAENAIFIEHSSAEPRNEGGDKSGGARVKTHRKNTVRSRCETAFVQCGYSPISAAYCSGARSNFSLHPSEQKYTFLPRYSEVAAAWSASTSIPHTGSLCSRILIMLSVNF